MEPHIETYVMSFWFDPERKSTYTENQFQLTQRYRVLLNKLTKIAFTLFSLLISLSKTADALVTDYSIDQGACLSAGVNCNQTKEIFHGDISAEKPIK